MVPGVFRLLAAAVGVTAAVALAPPAAAASSIVISPTTWAYTDSGVPNSTYVDPSGDAPVGAQVYASGTVHSKRTYFTFDLTKLAGTSIGTAYLLTEEKSAADCSATRTQQVWLTATATSPTWAKSPAERKQLPGPTTAYPCPSGRVVWNATDVLREAVAGNAKNATLELRLPADQEADPALFRSFGHAPLLEITYNTAPTVPTNLQVDGKPCGDHPVVAGNNLAVDLSATPSDADRDQVSVEFDWWPVRHPDQVAVVHELYYSSDLPQRWSIPREQLLDGTTYAWRARADDKQLTSRWSAVCRFTTDFTPPPTPTVSSVDYPTGTRSGGTGIPGAFTFSGNGNPDIVAFRYGTSIPGTYIAADHPGGTAAVTITPTSTFPPGQLVVEAVDAGGNLSDQVTYTYLVADNSPTVTCTPEVAYVGTPRTCTMTPYDRNDVGYRYSLDNGPSVELAGATASFTVTPTADNPYVTIHVQARLSNGNLTESTTYYLSTLTGAPTVDKPAEPVARNQSLPYTFHAVLPGSTSFTYVWENYAPVTVPVGSDGTATVSLTADGPWSSEPLTVYSTTADGTRSGATEDSVLVDLSGTA
jgi:hypothetical protein